MEMELKWIQQYQIAPTDLYQTKIYVELLQQIPHRNLIEVLTSTHTPQHLTHCGIAASLGWKTHTFESDARRYRHLCRQLSENQLLDHVTPIYTYLGLRPSLDHAVLMVQKPIGILRLEHDRILDLLEGLNYCLINQMIDCMILKVKPSCQPTNRWLELLFSLEKYGYRLYDLSTPQITPTTQTIQLVSWDLNLIHVTNEITLLCIHKARDLKCLNPH
uniref:Uncharacterized protein n=1 Tax=viral metagenome TaxID=1070528 RepID=A0A6C0BKR0_9ZZZZ